MAQYKRVKGCLKFEDNTRPESNKAAKAEFDQIVTKLALFYQGETDRTAASSSTTALAVMSTPATADAAATPDGTGTASQASGDAPTQLPFTVMLSFEERPAAETSELGVALTALFRRLVDVAKSIPGPHQAGALILDALDTLLQNEPQAREPATVARLWKQQALQDRLLDSYLRKAAKTGFGPLFPSKLTREQWQELIGRLVPAPDPADRVGGAAAAPPAGVPGAVAGPGAGAAPGAVGVPAPGPAAGPVAPPNDGAGTQATPVAPGEAEPETGFNITQLMGWLSMRGEGDERKYFFDIGGMTRVPDDEVEYGSVARLDLFGPDGSQLLTEPIDSTKLKEWLDGGDKQDWVVKVNPTRELRAALTRNAKQRQQASTASGRLWFSDGRPFGIRTLAVYVKPALSKLVDECSPPGELAFHGGCGEDEGQVPILQVPQALAVTQTDQAGYFEFSYTGSAPCISQYALIQVSGLAIPLALEMVSETYTVPGTQALDIRTDFPTPILLQVDSDLILPEPGDRKSTKWLDGQCDDEHCRGIDFTEPNRALEEFRTDIVVRTTDPLIERSRLDGSVLDGQGGEHLSLHSRLDSLFRTHVSRERKIEWDQEAALAQAVTISHGRILTLRQVWRADGYSLGDLRYSLPLAPLQKKNIAVIEWDRQDRLRMESAQEYQETLNNRVSRERDISEIVNTALRETMRGESQSRGSSGSGGFGLSLGPLFGGTSGGSSSAWSSSSQESTRSIAANSLNQLRDQTVQAANAVRSQRTTVVQQVDQSESARVVTETVANRNACHAITVQYFEVLRHFRVDHELAAVRECLYVPLPVTPFDEPKALRWAESITRYLPPDLARGFEACERLASNAYDKTPTYAHELVTGFSGTLEFSLDFPLPPAKLDDTTPWDTYFGMNFAMPSPLPTRFAELRAQPPDARAMFFQQKIAPVLAEKVISSLKFIAETTVGEIVLDIASTLDSQYRPGERHRVSLVDRGGISAKSIVRQSLTGIRVEAFSTFPAFNRAILHGGELVLTTPHVLSRLASVPADGSSWATTGKATLPLPPRPHETMQRKAEDEALKRRLLKHLADNTLFYHKAIWWTMDQDRRFTILDGFIAPNAGGRSVASVVENRIAAIVGNCLVMPVAPGIRLDYFQENAEDGNGGNDDEDWLLARYRPLIPNPTTRISVPTAGVFAESVMGSCNGCERMDDSRNWKYWEHPLPDEPTPIAPVSLDSRERQVPDVSVPAWPAANIVNQVTGAVPEAPAPTGLAGAISAIVNGAAFRDMTGLSGTQQSQRDALTQSYNTTQRFGELGAELSKKKLEIAGDALKMVVAAYTGGGKLAGLAAMGQKGDAESVKKSIAADVAGNRISEQQGRDLIGQVNQRLVEGVGNGATQSLPNAPEVREAIARARDEGSPVSISNGDARVDIGAPTREPVHPPAGGSKASTAPGWWPFSRPKSPASDAPKLTLPTLRIEIVTAIRAVGSARQVGEKSRQILVLDCEKRTLSLPTPSTGHTQFFRWKLKSVRDRFTASLDDWHEGVFSLTALGQTASGIRVMPDIDYRLRFAIDPRERRIHITGAHDGFPSYSVLVNGGTVYDYEQNIFEESAGSLMGTSDVEVDRFATYRP